MRFNTLLALCAVALLLCAPAFAQLDAGVIVGRVTDQSGAVVPDAKITVVAIDTNFEYPTVTTANGDYRVPALHPGSYRLTVEAAGFKKMVREGLTLRMSENLQVDLKLEIGEVAESVEVTAAAPLLDTQTSSGGKVVEGDYFYKLPTSQKWAKAVAYQTPGVNYIGAPWAGTMGTMDILGQGNITIYEDGMLASRGNSYDAVGGISNSIEEVKVLTSAMPAEYGHMATGMISFVKKTGANTLHGLVNEDVYTTIMYQRRFFDQKTQTQLGNHTSQWQPEFNFGGPVYLPKIYNGKNKTFFFVSMMWIYGTTEQPLYYTNPTAAMAAGDFSTASAIAAGAPSNIVMNTIYDPATLRQVNGLWYRDPLPGNIVPQNRFSKVAAALLNPNPYKPGNIPGTWTSTGPTSNIYAAVPVWLMYDTYTWRIDHQIRDNLKVYTSASIYRNTPSQFPKDNVCLSNLLYDPAKSTLRNWQSDPSAGMIWSVTPTLVSETKIGLYRYTSNPDSPGQFLIAQLFQQAGIPNIGKDWFIPQITPYPNSNGYSQGTFGQPQESVSVQNNEDFKEDVTKVWRNHAFKMGYEFLWENQISHNIANLNASFNYTGSYGIQTNGTTTISNTGNSMAEFEMGYVSSASFTKQASSWLPIISNQNVYIQDDWKITPTLTLNLGLRYMNENPLHAKWNQMSVWSPNVKEVDAAGNTLYVPPAPWGCPATGCSGGYLHNVSSFYNRDNNNFQPRFGLAWHPFDKWVFRGGLGVNTQDMGFWYSNRSEMDQSYSQSAPTGSPNGYYQYNINQGPTAWAFPPTRADGSQPATGNLQSRSATWVNPNIKNPYSMTWNISVQRQLGQEYQVQLTYEGSNAVGMTGTASWNSRPYAMIPDPSGNGTWMNLADPANASYRAGTFNTYNAYFRPWINWGGISYQSNFGHFVYHGGTVSLEKRYSHGVTLHSFLTYSKGLQWGPGNPYLNWGLTRAVVSANQKLRYVGSLDWELPIGKGRLLFNRGGWFNAIFGQWNLDWSYQIWTGSPAGISVTGLSRTDYPSYMPTYSGSGFLLRDPRLRDNWQDIGGDRFTAANQNSLIDCGAMVLNWGNNCVAAVPNYTIGNLPGNEWYLQRMIAASMAVSKEVTMHERLKWRFRFFFQNPFHWANWSAASTSLNIVNATNALTFGKITGLGDTGTASLGGSPIIHLEMGLKW